jgi:TetR/AcrR family transcriptional regulator, lmrAB and yxaGH operons repressor
MVFVIFLWSIDMKGQRTRAKYVETASSLFQTRGYDGVGLAELVHASGAPKGSFYFHFKGGKEELAVATILKSRQEVVDLLSNAVRCAKSPEQYIERIGKALMQWLTSTNFTEGCAVASMALAAAGSSEVIALACRECYRAWIDLIHVHLSLLSNARVVSPTNASSIMSALEGAVILCRCERSVAPMKKVVAYLSSAQSTEVVRR